MWSQLSARGVAGCAELCRSRILRQHPRSALRHASRLRRRSRLRRQLHWLHVTPDELSRRCVPPFVPLSFVTWYAPWFFAGVSICLSEARFWRRGRSKSGIGCLKKAGVSGNPAGEVRNLSRATLRGREGPNGL